MQKGVYGDLHVFIDNERGNTNAANVWNFQVFRRKGGEMILEQSCRGFVTAGYLERAIKLTVRRLQGHAPIMGDTTQMTPSTVAVLMDWQRRNYPEKRA